MNRKRDSIALFQGHRGGSPPKAIGVSSQIRSTTTATKQLRPLPYMRPIRPIPIQQIERYDVAHRY